MSVIGKKLAAFAELASTSCPTCGHWLIEHRGLGGVGPCHCGCRLPEIRPNPIFASGVGKYADITIEETT